MRVVLTKISTAWFNLSCWIEDRKTALEVVLTVAAIGVAYFVWDETHRQTKISQKAFIFQGQVDSLNRYKDSVSAAIQAIRDSIQARKDSIVFSSQDRRDSLSRETFRVANRAYMVFESIENITVHGDSIDYTIIFKNAGQTPAFRVNHFGYVQAFQTADELFQQLRRPVVDSGTVIGRDLPFRQSTINKKLLLDVDIRRYNSGMPLYLTYVVTYKDIFNYSWYSSIYISFTKGSREYNFMRTYNEACQPNDRKKQTAKIKAKTP